MMMKPRALVLHATGTNRDGDAARALELAGAEPEIVHINKLKAKEKNWKDYSILVIPAAFHMQTLLVQANFLPLI